MGYEVSMDFCPNCGRQRAGSDRFCGGCGASYPERSDVTRVDVPAEVTRTDTPASAKRAQPPQPADDPFASWYSADSPGAAAGQPSPPTQQGPGGPSGWQPTETLYAAPGGQAGSYPPAGNYPPPSPAGPVYPQAFGPRRSRGKGFAFFLVSLVVVLGAGGGAYALVSMSGKNHSSQPATTNPATGSSTGGTTAGSSTPTTPTQGSATSPTSATSSAGSAAGVALGPGVAAGANTTLAVGLLNHYFHGINTHDYAEYSAVLDPGLRAGQPQSSFDSGYATTQDSGMTLTSLADAGGGELAATVTFTSHQDPAQSADKKSSCNNWTLTLYLAKQSDGSYLMTHPPAGYHATFTDC
jgi:hypothetical protein